MEEFADILWNEGCLESFKRIPDGSVDLADCLSRMIISLEDAGFKVNFTPLFWAYASGFPKAQNIGKAVDKRLGAKREVIGKYIHPRDKVSYSGNNEQPMNQGTTFTTGVKNPSITSPSTPQAKALDGSYAGWQPKPAVEVIIVAMKPLSEKTYVDQALKNGKGITWLDDGRIPTTENLNGGATGGSYSASEGWDRPWRHNPDIVDAQKEEAKRRVILSENQGRFPANLLVSDDVLNDGRITGAGIDGGGYVKPHKQKGNSFYVEKGTQIVGSGSFKGDSGSFSRYFDLDKWFGERIKQLPASVQKTFPFLIVPKASKSEKNKGLDIKRLDSGIYGDYKGKSRGSYRNNHPTVKPLKLMYYLITLGSREGDIVLDPFMGSGTTAVACMMLSRHFIGSEINKDYYDIATKRIENAQRLI